MSKATHQDGSPLFTTASVLALLFFVMIALQCTSTTAVMIRETGRWFGAFAQVVVYNGLAYVVAVFVFQVFS